MSVADACKRPLSFLTVLFGLSALGTIVRAFTIGQTLGPASLFSILPLSWATYSAFRYFWKFVLTQDNQIDPVATQLSVSNEIERP